MTRRQLLAHLHRTLAAYVPGIANRCGLPAREFDMVWRDQPSPASTAGGVIFLNYSWFRDHPLDYGALVHEYVHVIQSVPAGTCPGDVIEGFADAMRYVFGLFDPDWWRPSPTAAKIAALSYQDFRRLSISMASGEGWPPGL